MADDTLTNKDIEILSTAVATLYRTSSHRGKTALVVTAAGKYVMMTDEEAVNLINKVCAIAGKSSGLTFATAKKMAEEASKH